LKKKHKFYLKGKITITIIIIIIIIIKFEKQYYYYWKKNYKFDLKSIKLKTIRTLQKKPREKVKNQK